MSYSFISSTIGYIIHVRVSDPTSLSSTLGCAYFLPIEREYGYCKYKSKYEYVLADGIFEEPVVQMGRGQPSHAVVAGGKQKRGHVGLKRYEWCDKAQLKENECDKHGMQKHDTLQA